MKLQGAHQAEHAQTHHPATSSRQAAQVGQLQAAHSHIPRLQTCLGFGVCRATQQGGSKQRLQGRQHSCAWVSAVGPQSPTEAPPLSVPASPFVVGVCDLCDLVPAIAPEHTVIKGHQGAVCNEPGLVVLGPTHRAVRCAGGKPARVVCAVVALGDADTVGSMGAHRVRQKPQPPWAAMPQAKSCMDPQLLAQGALLSACLLCLV